MLFFRFFLLFSCWPKIGQSRTGQSRTKHFKLAKVGVGQSRSRPDRLGPLESNAAPTPMNKYVASAPVQCPQLQFIEKTVEIPDFLLCQGTQTVESSEIAPVRHVSFAETVEVVKFEPHHSAVPVLPDPLGTCQVQRSKMTFWSVARGRTAACVRLIAGCLACSTGVARLLWATHHSTVLRAARCSRQFCTLHKALSKEASNDNLWKLKPKMHMIQEMWEVQSELFGNPREFWTYRDERFMGAVSSMAHSRGDQRRLRRFRKHIARSRARGCRHRFSGVQLPR